MSITIHYGNKLELLAEILLEEVQEEIRKEGFFYVPEIIVPNKGIGRFLILQMTKQYGIAFGLEFPFLISFLNHRVFRMKGSAPEQGEEILHTSDWLAEIRPETIAWRIFKRLPEMFHEREFESLKRWVGDGTDQIRLWEFSSQMGRMYDQYMLHRPDWIMAWEKGEIPADIAKKSAVIQKQAVMQGKLWRRIVEPDWKNHFACQLMNILEGNAPLPKLKHPVRIFGFSVIAEPVLRLLERLGSVNEIVLYNFEPCETYWGEAQSEKDELKKLAFLQRTSRQSADGKIDPALADLFFQNNMLLGSFAGQNRDFILRLLNMEGVADPSSEAFREYGNDTVLHQTQQMLLENSDCGNNGTPVPGFEGKECPSLQFHSCYTPIREVEVLHDFLLRCFEEAHGTLHPNEIFIMTPDRETYAPLVDAVFHNPNIPENEQLHVSIADQVQGALHTSLNTFLRILNLYRTKFGPSDVFAILHDPEVMNNLELSDEDLLFCGKKIAESGIRWGWDEKEHGTPKNGGVEFPEASWVYGLERLLLGYGMELEPEQAVQTDCGTYYSVRGFEEANGILLGKFIHAVEQLAVFCRFLRAGETESVSLETWQSELIGTAEKFFGERSAFLPFLRSSLENILQSARAGEDDLPEVRTSVMCSLMETLSAAEPSSANGFMTGRITFCGLRPMRSIPAKIICLLGMNHETFPSVCPRNGINLISSVPREGDPSLREDERQLFLDILLSAGERLYFSYVGRGIRDNKERPPSSCVSELKNWLERTLGKKSFLYRDEPLQAFSLKCFEESFTQSHSERMLHCAEHLLIRKNEDDPPRKRIAAELPGKIPEHLLHVTLDGLIRFFRNPPAALFRQRLKADPYENTFVLPEDSEMFGKPDVHLKNTLLQQLSDGRCTAENLVQKTSGLFRANAEIPYSKDETLQSLAQPVIEVFQQAFKEGPFNEELPAWEGVFEVNGETVHLSLPATPVRNLNGVRKQIIVSSYDNPNYEELHLRHLAANLQESVTTLFCYGSVSGEIPPAEDAESSMTEILKLYLEGMKKPLLFFPRTAYSFACGDEEETLQENWFGEQESFAEYFLPEDMDLELLKGNAARFYGERNPLFPGKENSDR